MIPTDMILITELGVLLLVGVVVVTFFLFGLAVMLLVDKLT
jgi:hypothetical protein